MTCKKCQGKGTYLSAGFDMGNPTKKEIECDLCEGTGIKGGYPAVVAEKLDKVIALLELQITALTLKGGKHAK